MRRTLMRAAGPVVLVAGLLLAGCGSDGGDEDGGDARGGQTGQGEPGDDADRDGATDGTDGGPDDGDTGDDRDTDAGDGDGDDGGDHGGGQDDRDGALDPFIGFWQEGDEPDTALLAVTARPGGHSHAVNFTPNINHLDYLCPMGTLESRDGDPVIVFQCAEMGDAEPVLEERLADVELHDADSLTLTWQDGGGSIGFSRTDEQG